MHDKQRTIKNNSNNQQRIIKAESKNNTKINNLYERQNVIKAEYQKLKVTAEQHYFFDKNEIERNLKHTTPPSEISEHLLIIHAERDLNYIPESEYQKIAGQQKKLSPALAREHEIARTRERNFEIER